MTGSLSRFCTASGLERAGTARSSWRATQATPPATRAYGHWDHVCREACHAHRGQLQLHRKQGQEFDFELQRRLAQGGVSGFEDVIVNNVGELLTSLTQPPVSVTIDTNSVLFQR